MRTFKSNHTLRELWHDLKLETAFIMMGEIQQCVVGWWPINERICKLLIKGRIKGIKGIISKQPSSGLWNRGHGTIVSMGSVGRFWSKRMQRGQ